MPHIFPHCQHNPVGLLLEGNRVEALCPNPVLSSYGLDRLPEEQEPSAAPKGGFVHGIERASKCWTHFCGLWMTFYKSILGSWTWKYSREESRRDLITLYVWLRWGFQPLCVLGDKALTLIGWDLIIIQDSEDHVDKSQHDGGLAILFLSFFYVLCCTVECFLHQNLWLRPASLPPP